MSSSADEVGWIKTHVLPLFRSLGFRRVDFVHGPLEAGRDVVMADFDRFGLLKYYAVQAKDGDLRARSDSPEINTILDQIRTAFETPYRDPLSGTEHKIAGVYLVINGSITESARNILYSKTGGWFSIVDLSQLELAPLLLRTVSDDDRRMCLVAVQTETFGNRNVLEEFLLQLQEPMDERVGLTLPFRPLRTRSMERYLDIGYHELHLCDIGELEKIVQCSEFFNFLIGKLPLGPSKSEYLGSTLNSIRAAGDLYVEMSYRLHKGVDELLVMERPAPGKRFAEQVFSKIKGDGDDPV